MTPASLRLVREGAGVGLRELARRLGLSAAYVSDVELGHRGVTAQMLAAYEALEGKR